MNNTIFLGIFFIFITLVGFYSAYLYGRRTKQFLWREYWAIVIWPLLSVLAFAYFVDVKIIILFLVSCLVGFLFEYLTGLTYYLTLSKRLWVYSRLSIGGHTSLLSIPLWGIAGVLFWYISVFVGL